MFTSIRPAEDGNGADIVIRHEGKVHRFHTRRTDAKQVQDLADRYAKAVARDGISTST